jgi:hypothetical protein
VQTALTALGGDDKFGPVWPQPVALVGQKRGEDPP